VTLARLTGGRLAVAGGAAVSAVVAGLLAMMPIAEPDLFWHLAVGGYIAEHGALPGKNLWSFTAPDHPFLASSWLFDLLLHRIEARGGMVAVQAVTALAVGATFLVLFLAVRTRGASTGWAVATAVALALGAEARFTPRPQVFSYLLLSLISWVLLRNRSRRSWGELALVPVLLAIWANLHAGVVFGVALVGCHLLGLWAPSLGPGVRWPERRLVGGSVLALAACMGALLLNPGGVDLLRYALFHVSEVGSVVRLGEFETPGLLQRPLFWVVLVGLPLLLLACRREVSAGEWCAWLLFGGLAVRAVRLIPEFFLVVGPSLGWAADRCVERWAPRAGAVGQRLAAVAPLLLPVLAVLVLPYPAQHLVRRIHLGLDPFRNPVRAIARARQWGLGGRMFAGWDVSGMVEWALPEARVQVDPRLLAYPPSVFHELEAAEDSREQFEAYVDRWELGWALRSQQRLRFTGAGLFAPRRWAVVFWDEGGQILVRRDLPRFEELVRAEEFQEFLPATSLVEAWRSLRGARRERWLAEAERLAGLSPLLVDAHAALCLEDARVHELTTASEECDRAAAAADERFWTHPTPGGLRSESAAIAQLVLAGEVSRRGAGPSPDALLARATELAPASADVWAGVGAVLLDRAEPARAVTAFRRALALDPGHRPATEGLARAEQLSARGR
jgi:hypothetical protein